MLVERIKIMEENVYRPSKYNILIEDGNHSLTVANTLTCVIQKYSASCSEKIKRILATDIIDCNDKIVDTLKESKFIVGKEIDETQRAIHNYTKKLYYDQKLILTIVPTEDCNMRCTYCYEEHRQHYMSDTKVDLLIKFLKKRMRTASAVLIRWFGGEPLLCLDMIVKVMSKVQEFGMLYKIPVEGQMTTNGVLLDEIAFEKLYSCGVRTFQITLNGFKKDHNKYRPMVDGSDSFTIITENLIYILRQRKRVSITIRVNILENLMDNIYRFIDYLKENYLFDNRFSLVLTNVRNLGGNRVKHLDLLEYDELDPVMNYAIDKGILPVGSSGLEGNEMCCEASTINSFYINWDLSVYKCGNTIYSDNPNIGRLGKIDHQGIIQIDENKLALWMKQVYMTDDCFECKYFPLCMSHFCPYSINFCNFKDCSAHKGFILNKILAGAKYIEIKELEVEQSE